MGLFQIRTLFLCLLLVLETCIASIQQFGRIYPGYQASQMVYIDNKGIFLRSNDMKFALGFYTSLDVTLFLLVIIHMPSSRVVWTANRGFLVGNSDCFVFGKNGNVYLEHGNGVAWSTNTTGETAKAMELQDTGNLVLVGGGGRILWQSFSHPTDTLLPGQEFLDGMQLKSFPNRHGLSHYLDSRSGDLILSAGFETPQLYWSISKDTRKTNNSISGKVHSVTLVFTSWNFYDQNKTLLWQFVFSNSPGWNAFWAAVLGSDGSISFYDLQKGKSVTPEAIKIPPSSCGTPEPCDPYHVCSFDNRCQCPSLLRSNSDCKPQINSMCNGSKSSVKLLHIGEELNYFALNFVTPLMKPDLDACKEACLGNCSCLVLFFENSSGSCILFDQIGSLQRSNMGSTSYSTYMKVSGGLGPAVENRRNWKSILIIMVIAFATVTIIIGLLYAGYWYLKKKISPRHHLNDSEEDDFLDNLPGMPLRFSYINLSRATQNFSTKIGQGGFGSVYVGVLPDGTQVAVKKLESTVQGTKEFKAEVTTIGSIHHVHLVKLKGFCAEGPHRLLVYEYMEKGSLDKWIFNKNEEGHLLDWDTRFNIALGTAKGLAYLHEECEVKIVHCDIKPENVLLDDNFVAKVSDFGMAKLMNREQSIVYTTLRGTRGYLAPEWITNFAISEKSDVYSYGMVLLEIVGGRKNYDSGENSEKVHFPSYAFKMLEEGKLKEIIDTELEIDERDDRVVTAIKLALWCIQDDMHLRPPMTKVVQILEGFCAVPPPPTTSQLGSLSAFSRWSSQGATSSGFDDYSGDVASSDVRLSGPR
ncbi:G-type lectin S-receptor-like serine/threonine-protein kinase SD2-5 [Carya illinoinensis]|uniref:Receptor-like serine/threonine-protein kinase n=1 Tax=Carya illinoinensis TaxID=32201 RepID=A0A8T1RRB0_CARIL|nr:G-type lectin S-receptor-like serine/threonine-protein kinase SD2-5 [Carya illinoinensis]KAG6669474.1 hypothetical protein CIPAW_01G246900 [Carya illinoinensis]KAG6733944.1 hypothetical protein I3842_01G248300 [Carya illinoinensis]KAG6733945.1 hypothetical protein I3842_01G248300 [Carya illinoinensis]